MTPRIIRIIALECVIIIITITMIGAAVIEHNRFKAEGSRIAAEEASSAVPVEGKTSAEKTTEKKTAAAPEKKSNYEYSYAGFDPAVADTSSGVSGLLLNRNYVLPDNYKPVLKEIAGSSGIYLDERAAPYFQAMYDDAKEDGIVLNPLSGYRSVQRQKRSFENMIKTIMREEDLDREDATKAAAERMMLPGSSEHNAGLAVDVCSQAKSFENTKEFEWLSENAAEYGFILRYPKSDEAQKQTGMDYEPWHYRFVGVNTAKEIKRKGVTLEEYLGAVQSVSEPSLTSS